MTGPSSYLEEKHFSRDNDMFKGPETGLKLVCVRSIEEASVAKAESSRGRGWEVKVEREPRVRTLL